MGTACHICGGAIPHKEEQYEGHTALCAGVLGEKLDLAVAALKLIAGIDGTECAYPRAEADKAIRTLYPALYDQPTSQKTP